MRIWVTQTGEPYPFLPGTPLMRTGLLVHELVKRGHEVLWWGAGFDHQRKQVLASQDQERQCGERLRIRLLAGYSYTRNYSLRRYLHHKKLARGFAVHSRDLARPELILSALPIHDLAFRAVRYGKRNRIPVLVDVRDLWPDSFVTSLPAALRPLARLALYQDFRRARAALRGATGLISISRSYLDWALAGAGRAGSANDAVFYIGSSPLPAETPAEQQLAGRLAWASQPADRIILGFLGTFGRTYDLELVLEAAARLAQQGDQSCHFLLAGSGDRWPELAARAETLANVTLTGWLGAEQIRVLLRRCDIGLAPYIVGAPQSLPNKPFTYLSAGLPVLSSLSGELAELLADDQCGLTYKAGDVDSLVAVIQRMTSDQQLRDRLAAGARRAFASWCDATTIYHAYADHLEHVALTPCRPGNRATVRTEP